jgi:hypothetical protein
MVMKPAEDGHRYDAAHVLDGAMDRSVFVERPMSPQLVVVSRIPRQNSAQVRLDKFSTRQRTFWRRIRLELARLRGEVSGPAHELPAAGPYHSRLLRYVAVPLQAHTTLGDMVMMVGMPNNQGRCSW